MMARARAALLCMLSLLLLLSCGDGRDARSIADILCEDVVRLTYRTSLAGASEGELTEQDEIRAVLQPLCALPMTCDTESGGLPAELYTASMIMGGLSMTCTVEGDDATYGVSVTKTGLVYITVVTPDGRVTVYYTEDGAVAYESVLQGLGMEN